MTPSNQGDRKLLEDVAMLVTQVKDLKDWRIAVDKKDDAQDLALYKLEGEVRDVKKDLAIIIKTQDSNTGKLKAILTLVLIPALDAAGWNTWKYGKEFLEPLMTRNTFYLVITTAMICLLLYAGSLFFNRKRKGESNGTGR